jgi:hypothetical protein
MEYREIYERHAKCVYICDKCLFETSSKTKLLLHEDDSNKCARMQIYRFIKEDLEIKKINKNASSNFTMEKIIRKISTDESYSNLKINYETIHESSSPMSSPMITKRKKQLK